MAKLLVVGEEYKKVEHPLIPGSPATNIRKIVEPKRSNTGSDITEMYTFDIDPVQGLKTKSAEGYLYLAYLLFTQSKYAEAIYYLRKAQDIRPKISEKTEKILGWFENWKSDSPRAKTVLMHVQILKLEQLKTLHTKPPLTIETQNVLKNAMATYKDYQKWVKENKIDQTLYLSPKERNDLFYVCQEISNQIKSIIEQLGERAGISREGQAFFNSIEEFIENFLRENQEGDNILTNEIEQLKRQIKINIDNAAAKGANVKVENETNFESPVFENVDQILIKESENKAGNLVSNQIIDLETEFSKYEGYTNELGKELITDVQIALNKQQESEYQFVKEINFNKLRADLKVKNDQLDKEVQEKKKAVILSSFVLKSIPAGSLDEIKRNLKEEDATKEKFFDEALFAYGANNWKELLDQYVIHQGQIEELDRLIEDFLITATKKQQYGQSLVLIEEFLQNPADTVVANQLITLLNTKRYYNPMSDAYKRACLMLEYDSKIIARKSQIQNVHDMLKQENLFKHEALAGGKTTVLRNIITKIKADGINLSGIITHDALIEMHHALFRNTTTNAYGDKAIRFEFCRKDPSDLIALKALLRNLLKTVANHGRIDMTKKDALSFHHSYLMKFEELLKGQKVDEINQEIDLMNEIFLLLREHCRIGSDEMDKVCDPEKEHNYATGEKGSIDPVKRDAAFEMVKWILADKKGREIFTSNTQYRLMEQGGNLIRKWMAKNSR